MATDPTAMFGALLGTLQQTGNIEQDAQQNADQQQAAKQQLTMGAIQLAAARQKQAQQAQYQQDVQSYYADPTLDRLSALAAKYPQQAAALKQSYDIMNEAQRQSALTQFGSLYNAADNNKPELVRSQLQQLKTAEQKQGIDTSDIDQAMDAIDADPASAMRYIKGFAQLHLSAAGVDKFQLGDNQNHYSQFGSGGIFDQRTGEIVQQPADKPQYVWDSANSRFILKPGTGGGDHSSGGGGASSTPRSVRNNNPGNLKASPFTRKLPGFSGVDPDGFATFESPQAGANAQVALLKNYISRGFNTVSKIINRWAPSSDNNDTAAYIQTVAGKLGVNPNDTLSPAMVPQLQAAITGVEGGPNNPSNELTQSASPQVVDVPVSGSGGLSDGAVTNAAAVYRMTGQLPTRISQKDKEAILNRSAQMVGNNVGDMLANWASRKSDQAALTSIQKMSSQIESFENTALRNGALALRLAAQVDNGNFPIFNAWKNAGGKATGNPKVKAFDAAIKTFADEYAKIVSSATGGGVTSDSAREAAESRISSSDSPQQLQETMHTLVQDMLNRRKSLDQERENLLGRIRNGNTPDVPAAAPSGFRILRVRPAQ